ncbi:type II secretion system F family protein [Streptomyces sp. NPDC102462]|uniref:type II secretion system F family protein n=1 Tax=Streptomyces sp. NPDC102462 TaxID=3366178 RepID=UPI0037FBA60E
MSADVVHRLGVAAGAALGLGWLVRQLVVGRRERRARGRLAGLLTPRAPAVRAPASRRAAGQSAFEARAAVRRWLPWAGAVCAGWVLVGGVAGAVVGLGVAVALWRWRRRQRAAAGAGEADAAEAARQLPLAADLLAACIAAGAGPVIAAQAVGEALAGPVGEGLARGAAEVRLGGEPADAWRRLAALPGARPLARLLERADESGLPAAGPVARLATDARAQWARTATARARRAAVMVTAPVGLCFLPAFVTVGVLPVVIGLAGGVLRGGGG